MTQCLAASARRGLGEGRGLEVILCEGGCVNTFVALFDEFFCALLYMMAGKRREECGGGKGLRV